MNGLANAAQQAQNGSSGNGGSNGSGNTGGASSPSSQPSSSPQGRERGDGGKFTSQNTSSSKRLSPAKQRILADDNGARSTGYERQSSRQQDAQNGRQEESHEALEQLKGKLQGKASRELGQENDQEPQVQAQPAEINAEDPTTWPEQIRAKVEGTQRELAEATENNGKWESLFPRAIEQNQRLMKELELWRAIGQEHGVSPDDRDIQLAQYQVKETNATKLAQMASAREQEQETLKQESAQAASKAKHQQAANSWLADSQKTAKKAGVEWNDVAEVLHGQLAAGREADLPNAIEWARARSLSKQRDVNKTAPTSINTSIPAGTTMPRDRTANGRLSRLRALGHDV